MKAQSLTGHKIAKRQMQNGYGGVLAFGLNADYETHNRFVAALRVITSPISLDHVERQLIDAGERNNFKSN